MGAATMANEGPSLTKATYDKKRTKRPAPSPEQRKADQEIRAIFAAKDRAFDKRVKTVGLAEALFPGITPPKEPIKRRF